MDPNVHIIVRQLMNSEKKIGSLPKAGQNKTAVHELQQS